MPDPDSARMDPFREVNTLILQCNVHEPKTGKDYDRDPRSLGLRAEAYLKSTGIGDTAYFGPEPEFFIFDSVRWEHRMGKSFFEIDSEEGPWATGLKTEGGNLGYHNRVKGGYFPVSPVDSFADMRSEMCTLLEQQGVDVEIHHHEVGGAGQCEIGTRFNTLVKRADWTQILKYTVHNVAAAYGKTATFMPKPIEATTVPACTSISPSGRTARTSLRATVTPVSPSLRSTTSAASSSTPAPSMPSRIRRSIRIVVSCPALKRP